MTASSAFAQNRIRHCGFVTSPFSKAKLLNYGLVQSNAKLVLVSDADIVWNSGTLDSMIAHVLVQGGFCHVRDVRESNSDYCGSSRMRLRPVVTVIEGTISLSIIRDYPTDENTRPGPGLLLGLRTSWIDVGGFNEDLNGWGWEDQDFLIRAEIIGYSVAQAGTVVHLSHDDNTRNIFHANKSKTETRDANILLSSKAIQSGRIRGPLAASDSPELLHPIRVRFLERSA